MSDYSPPIDDMSDTSSSILSMGDITMNSELPLCGVQTGDDDNRSRNVELPYDIDLPHMPNIKIE